MSAAEAHLKDRRLWQSVVLQAVADATSKPNSGCSRREAEAARRWLTTNGKDFRDVCECAGMDPDRVRSEATALIAKADALPALPPKQRRSTGRRRSQPGKPPSIYLEHDGLRLTLHEWSIRTGIPKPTLDWRRRKGQPVESILAPSSGRFSRSRNNGAGGGKQLSSNAAETGAPVTRKIAPK